MVTIPNFHEAGTVLTALFDFWDKSKDSSIANQLKWRSTIKSIYNKLKEIQTEPVFKQGLYELVNSIHFTMVTNPKAVLNHYPCLASLGATSKRLKHFTKWNNHLFETIQKVSFI